MILKSTGVITFDKLFKFSIDSSEARKPPDQLIQYLTMIQPMATASVWDLNPEASHHHDEQGPLRHYDQHVGWVPGQCVQGVQPLIPTLKVGFYSVWGGEVARTSKVLLHLPSEWDWIAKQHILQMCKIPKNLEISPVIEIGRTKQASPVCGAQ